MLAAACLLADKRELERTETGKAQRPRQTDDGRLADARLLGGLRQGQLAGLGRVGQNKVRCLALARPQIGVAALQQQMQGD